jgi:hypothetical protein
MVFAVIAVRVVQMAVHEVVDVVPMRDGFVTAARSVDVALLMPAAGGGVSVRIFGRHGDDVLVDMIALRMVEMPVIQIIHVSRVLHGDVPAAGPMVVGLIFMNLGAHRKWPF